MNDDTKIDEAGFDLEGKQIEKLLENIQQPVVDNTRIKYLVHEKLTKEKLKNLHRGIIKVTISSVATIAIIFFVAIWLYTGEDISLGTTDKEKLLSAGYKEIVVPHGKPMDISLSDGSHLIANCNTKVIYPEKFTGKQRKIYVDGEVYIDVAKDLNHPFIVESPGLEIKVLGTKFNIENRSDSISIVVLVEGSIDLSTSKKQTIRLRPNDLVDIEKGEITELRKVDASDYISWVKGLRSVNGETMKNIISRLSEFYGVTIKCDDGLSEVKIYGKLDLRDSLHNVLSSINNIVPMEIKREGNSINLKMVELN